MFRLSIRTPIMATAVAYSLIATVGCSSGGGGSSPAVDTGVPATFQKNLKSQMLESKPMTQQLMERVRLNAIDDRRLIPRTGLIFDEYDKAESRRRDLSILDADGRAFLQSVKANCKISPGPTSRSGEAKVGSHQITDQINQVSGKDCPVAINSTSHNDSIITELDEASGVVSLRTDGHMEESFSVLQPPAGSNVSRQRTLKTTTTAIVQKAKFVDGRLTSGSAYITADIAGEMTLIDGTKVPTKILFELFSRNGNERSMQALAKAQFPEGEVVVGIEIANEKKSFYVNGQPKTNEQILNELGMDPAELDQVGM